MGSMRTVYVYCFITSQKASTNGQQHSPLLFMLFGFILYHVVSQFNNIQKGFSRYWSLLHSQLRIGSLKAYKGSNNQYSESFNEKLCLDKEKDDAANLRREEVKMVMENLGLPYSKESEEELKERMSSKELSLLFDEKEPSLEEVKAAFDIFDEKKKGFIDAEDLQRVLHKLRFNERFSLGSCREMIKRFDQNGDGSIDFNEFVKFMANSFS